MSSLRRALVRAALVPVTCAALTGCSHLGTDPAAGDSSPSATARADSQPRRPPASESCPVTAPTEAGHVPPVLTRLREGGQDHGGWYGKRRLWVNVWWAPVSRVPKGRSGGYPIKWGTFTLFDGKFTSRFGPPTVRAERLDGPGTVRGSTGGYAHASDASGSTHEFWPTGIEFPSRGCWMITESVGGTVVRFVVRV